MHEERSRSTPPASAQAAASGVAVAAAEGSWVVTRDGRRLLDLTGGMGSCVLGHGHPEVVAAATRQLGALAQTGGVFDHAPQHRLAERLAGIAPAGLDRFAFATSGTEAVELALRLARLATGRDPVICFRGGFHGRTEGSARVTSAVRVPGVPGAGARVVVAPFPRPGPAEVPDDRAPAALAALDRLLARCGLPAAVVVEPVQGLGGCHPAGPRFLAGLRERCDARGSLLVLDEVQTGLGRTGDWFAAQAYEVRPDILCLAKGLGGGLPISAVGAPAWLWERAGAPVRAGTFGGSPPSCAAATAVIDVIDRDGLRARARSLGAVAARLLAGVAALRPWARARGLGLMAGLELQGGDGRPDEGRAEVVRRRCLALGVVVAQAGGVLRLLPPLTIEEDELCHGIATLGHALAAVESRSDRLAHAA